MYITLYVLNPRLAYKYRSGEGSTFIRDLSSLRDCQFYAGTRHALNDPFEGRFDRASLDAQLTFARKTAEFLSGALVGSLDGVRSAASDVLAFVDSCGVFSLSYNPLNELIWAHYGGSHKGFCIGYDVDQLTSFEPNQFHRIDVTYNNLAPTIAATDLLLDSSPLSVLRKMLGTKSSPWGYEEEVRVVATPAGLHEHDFRAVREVYFGLRCSEENRVSVMQALAGRGVRYKQVVSPHPSYLLAAEDVFDTFAETPPYRKQIAPIAEHAIPTSYLKADLQPYVGYLHKAAEIVRRDPYCPLVETVEFSGSRSTPGNPVVYVQYQRQAGKWITKHFSLAEIDAQYTALRVGQRDV